MRVRGILPTFLGQPGSCVRQSAADLEQQFKHMYNNNIIVLILSALIHNQYRVNHTAQMDSQAPTLIIGLMYKYFNSHNGSFGYMYVP